MSEGTRTVERADIVIEDDEAVLPAVFGMPKGGYRVTMPVDARYAAQRSYAGQPLGGQHKVAGFLSWLAISLCVIGIFSFPGRLSLAVGAIVTYLLARMAVTVVFSIAGSIRCRSWEARDWSDADAVASLVTPRVPDPAPPFAPDAVHHVVLLPNYKETVGVLEATLAGLARQDRARECVTVVLAMEQKEPGSAEKGAMLAERFAPRFANLLVTMHPANLPGEIACKGSNEAWAAREAKRFIVDEAGIPVDRVTVTSCDADSILHPRYLSAIARMFSADTKRHEVFYQAPMFYYNNLWKVPTPVRLMAYFTHALLLAELANPLAKPLPLSTYSMSLKLLHETGYWDPAVISEDWHIYLQAYFARKGRVALRRVFLPVSADMPDGDTRWKALVNMYHQSVRHSWGAEDVGYILQSWPGSGAPVVRTARLFEHVLRDHLLRSVPWFVFTAGSVLSAMTLRGMNPTLLHYPMMTVGLQYLWLAASIGMFVLLGVELHRFPPPKLINLPARFLEIVLAWVMLPVITLGFGAVPALYAQTKLMFGLGLSWRVTPKRFAEQLNEG